jgi:hypothetical protein
MTYSALDPSKQQIRLLNLHHGKPGDDIECHFNVVSLNDHDVQFEALSYTWGVSEKGHFVRVEGASIPVTDNLWSALNGLRYLDKERIIWADALCVSQLDNSERSDQVSHMNSIYSQAYSVEIWLGEPYEHVETAFQFITEFATCRTAEGKVPSYGYLHGTMPNGPNDYRSQETTAKASGERDPRIMALLLGMTRFAAMPWFERTWTVQEFFLAKKATFHCGAVHTLDGAILNRYLAHISNHKKSCCAIDIPLMWQLPFTYIFFTSHAIQHLKTTNMSFLDCVAGFRIRKATDLRDKLYGLLGLGVEDATNLVHIDYTLSVQQVYETFVHSLLSRTKNLNFLSHIKTDARQQTLRLPSFVPDWSLKIGEDLGNIEWESWSMRCRLLENYDAAAGTQADFKIHPGVLAIRGVIFDAVESTALRTVDSVQIAGKSGFSNLNYPDLLEECQTMAAVPPPDEDPDLAKREAFWIAMMAGIQEQKPSSHAPIDTAQGGPKSWRRIRTLDAKIHQAYERIMRTPVGQVSLDSLDDVVPEDLRLIDNAVGAAENGRKFMMTRAGRMGLVPHGAEQGDVVAVLTGG